MAMISVVIITKNEAANICACIASARQISSDIIVVDCGSTDDTVQLAKEAGARTVGINWQSYGHSRNTGAAAAKNNWIFALDADERISAALAARLNEMSLPDPKVAYKIKRKNYFGYKHLQFGTLGFEQVPRLYCRTANRWDLFPVHEKLIGTTNTQQIRESILHYGITDLQQYIAKKNHYALLSAYKYREQNKKATFVKRFLSPVFNGVKSYVFQLGFADGRKGWQIATIITHYTWLKYKYLHQFNKNASYQRFRAPKKERAFGAVMNLFVAKR